MLFDRLKCFIHWNKYKILFKNYLQENTILVFPHQTFMFLNVMLLAIYLIICEMYQQFLSESCFKVNPTPIHSSV